VYPLRDTCLYVSTAAAAALPQRSHAATSQTKDGLQGAILGLLALLTLFGGSER
jgi:hypothetical protein